MKIQTAPPYFTPHLIEFGGKLPENDGAHACWYYARLASRQLEKMDDGRVFEDDPLVTAKLEKLAWAVSKLYSLKDPGEFFRFIKVVKSEAKRCMLPWDTRLEFPFNDAIRKKTVYTDESEKELWDKVKK